MFLRDLDQNRRKNCQIRLIIANETELASRWRQLVGEFVQQRVDRILRQPVSAASREASSSTGIKLLSLCIPRVRLLFELASSVLCLIVLACDA